MLVLEIGRDVDIRTQEYMMSRCGSALRNLTLDVSEDFGELLE